MDEQALVTFTKNNHPLFYRPRRGARQAGKYRPEQHGGRFRGR
jgi:hypothetical protein